MKKIKIPIYNAVIEVHKTEDIEIYSELIGFDAEGCDAFVHRLDTLKYMAVFQTPLPISNLAHECYHIVNMLLKDVGIYGSLEDDEAGAYLIGFIFDKIYKIVNNDIKV